MALLDPMIVLLGFGLWEMVSYGLILFGGSDGAVIVP